MICGGDVTAFFQYLDHNDPIIMEIQETAEKFYEERKDFWLICDLLTTSGVSLYSPACGLIGTANVPSSVLSSLSAKPHRYRSEDYDLFSEQIGTSRNCLCIWRRTCFTKSLSQSLQVLIFAVLSWTTGRNLQILLFSQDAVETILCDFNHLDQYVSITAADYCCVMTRGHSYDTIVQAQLLATPACYIGVIGSRAKKKLLYFTV